MLRNLLASPHQHHAAPESSVVFEYRADSRPDIVLAVHIHALLKGAGRRFNEEQGTQD